MDKNEVGEIILECCGRPESQCVCPERKHLRGAATSPLPDGKLVGEIKAIIEKFRMGLVFVDEPVLSDEFMLEKIISLVREFLDAQLAQDQEECAKHEAEAVAEAVKDCEEQLEYLKRVIHISLQPDIKALQNKVHHQAVKITDLESKLRNERAK